MTKACRLMLFTIGVLAGLAAVAAEPPYPPSPVITAISWEDEIVRRADGSDNWPLTWGADGDLYTAYGDGWGFEPRTPKKLSLGYARISGPPESFSAVNIRSNGERYGGGPWGKKASGMLMFDGTLYMWVRNANRRGEQCQLAWSRDGALTWQWSDWRFALLGYCAFLNYGRDYADAPDSFVYMYSPNTPSAYAATDEVVLSRVRRDDITDRNAYEFFAGPDASGEAVWTRSIVKRQPVFRFADSVNRLDVTYNAPLGRYLMTMRSREKSGGQPHFGIYDAPTPWGPWTTVFYTQRWDVDPGESQHIPSKWISADGLGFYLVFSGDDTFSLRKAVLTVSGK